MNAIPKHYSLVKEHPQSYEIHDSRVKKNFHIAKSGLDLGMHAQLAKIPTFDDGGEIDSSQVKDNPDQIIADASVSPAAPEQPDVSRDPASSGYTPDPTVANEVDTRAKYLGAFMPWKSSEDLQKQAQDDVLKARQNSAENDQAAAADKANQVQADIQYNQEASKLGLPLRDVSNAPAPASIPQAQAPQNNAPAPNPLNDPLAKQEMADNAALGAERKALLAGANAEGEAGTKTAAAYAGLANKLDQMLTPQQIYENHQKADESLMKAYQDKEIDPNHYWNSKSTGSKITAGLGMLLGGMSAGTLGGENPAMKVIDGAIKRDIEAQKNSQDKTLNLWKLNREATQSEIQANLATQNQLLLGVKAQALQYAASAQGPEAKARIAPLISQIDQQTASNNFRRSLLSAASQNGGKGVLGTDPSMLLNLVPEQQRAEAAKEITAAKQLSQVHSQAMDTFNKLKEINTLGHMVTSPFQTSKQVEALRDNAAVNLARDEAGRVNEFEFKAAQQAFPAKGDSQETIDTKLHNLQGIINKKRNPGTVFQGATGMSLDNFKSTSTLNQESGAPQTATKNGIRYIKVPGGWKKAG